MKLKTFCAFILCIIAYHAFATTVYHLPEPGDDLIGHVQISQIKKGDTIYKISRRYSMGHEEMIQANPDQFHRKYLQVNKPFTIPSFFILPDAPREGIVINLPEMRLYYYPKHLNVVVTAPIAIGRPEWRTLVMETKVIDKEEDPVWTVPPSIMQEKIKNGVFDYPEIVPPGAENPLGKYALRLGNWSTLIHGTNQPEHIGKAVSSGCIRMYPDDIELLYREVPIGTPVRIINQPYLVGWLYGHLYFEAHPPFEEEEGSFEEELDYAYELINHTLEEYPHVMVDESAVESIIEKHTGIPHIIS
jgi:L,D-transpeptidase ErfK/SrfK